MIYLKFVWFLIYRPIRFVLVWSFLIAGGIVAFLMGVLLVQWEKFKRGR